MSSGIKKRILSFRLGEAQISLDAELHKKEINYLDWIMETEHEGEKYHIAITRDFVETLLKIKGESNESKE